jgi:spore coat protein U domain-containing protein, fimbrial subunit CupE1/2/3/6
VIFSVGAIAAARAGTATSTFNVTLTVTATCAIISTNTLGFGSAGVLTSAINATTTFVVQCTNTAPYTVALNPGSTTGATVTTRQMLNGATPVNYSLYRDAARTLNWGQTPGTDTVAGTGNGTNQTITIYGQVPIQSSPAPNTYSDTVTVTVAF